MKLMDVVRRWLAGTSPVAPCTAEEACLRTRLTEADQRLHDQATRLHVLEWEAYEHTSTRRRQAEPKKDRH